MIARHFSANVDASSTTMNDWASTDPSITGKMSRPSSSRWAAGWAMKVGWPHTWWRVPRDHDFDVPFVRSSLTIWNVTWNKWENVPPLADHATTYYRTQVTVRLGTVGWVDDWEVNCWEIGKLIHKWKRWANVRISNRTLGVRFTEFVSRRTASANVGSIDILSEQIISNAGALQN